MIKQFKKIFFYLAERWTQGFLTIHWRPLLASQIQTESDGLKNSPRLGLIVQGPIIKKNDFTLESLKLYQRHFSETSFILSTWADEDGAYLKKFSALGIDVVLNEKPNFAGAGNINYQIISVQGGIKRAKQLDCAYILKTRSDQRMYAPNIKEFLLNVIRLFPVRPGTKQQQRIVGISLDTFKYRPYGLSDMVMFGCLADMWLYWAEVDLDQRPPVPANGDNTSKFFYDQRICEMYLLTEFLKKIGHQPMNTIADSWQVFADYLCVVDQQSLDLYWPKYNRHQEYRRWNYDAIKNCQVLTFREWLNLYQGLDNKKNIPEEAILEPFDGQVKV